MDYQTKITIDASKAIRDLEKLEKVFNRNDVATEKLNDELKRLTKEQKLLESQIKKLTAADSKSAGVLDILIKKRRELAGQFSTLNALTKNEIANSRHQAEINKKLNTSTAKLAATYKKYGIALNGTSVFMKKAAGNASLFAQKQEALNRSALKTSKVLNANSVAITRYSRATKMATASNTQFAHSVSGINAFLKVQLVMFRTAMLAATAYAGVKLYIEFNKTAESVELLNKKLQTFTNEAGALDLVKESAFKTGFAMQDLGKIVTRFAVTTEGAFDTATLVKWTEGLVMSARAVGTTTMELNNALIQLSQSFSAGFLMGDEYRSISENLPLFKLALRDVADEAGMAGISLKELSSGRKIDIDLMTEALERLSKQSAEYVFALDTIEAAEGRVKVGWELFAESVANNQSVKDSLNFISGVLVNLSQDAVGMKAFNDNFSEMSEDVNRVANEFRELGEMLKSVWAVMKDVFSYIKDFVLFLKDNKEIVKTFMFAFVSAKVLGGITALISGFMKMKAAVAGATGAISLLSAHPIIAAGTAVTTLGFVIGQWIAEASKAKVETKELGESYEELEEKINPLIESFESLDFVASKANLIAASSEVTRAQDVLSSVREEIELVKQKYISGKIGVAEYDATVLRLNMTLEAAKAQVQGVNEVLNIAGGSYVKASKDIGTLDERFQGFLDSLASANADKKHLEYNQEFDQIITYKKEMIAQSRSEEEVTKRTRRAFSLLNEKYKEKEKSINGLTKIQREANKKEEEYQRNLNKVYEDGQKSLESYHDTKNKLSSELAELEQPDKVDFSEDSSGYLKSIEDIGKAFAANRISAEQYKKEIADLESLNEKIKAQRMENYLEDQALSYDEVKLAQKEYNDTLRETNELLSLERISESAATKAVYEKIRALKIAEAQAGKMNQQDQFFQGMNDGLYDFANNNKTVFEEMSELTTKSFSSMTDELTEFVTTGKADFKGLVDSIVKDLTRIAIQKSITEPLAGALFGGGSSGGGGIFGSLLGGISGIGGGSLGVGGMGPPTPGIFQENGGVWNNGSIQAFAAGGVVSSPTLFPMADGMGLMGEAGSEAIMPLKRGKDGKLGVVASGESTNITININVSGSTGSPEEIRRSAGQVAQAAGNATQRAMRRNG